MFRMKETSLLVFVFAVFLSSCAPGSDQSGQVATIVADSLTQTAPIVTDTPVSTPSNLPVNFPVGQKTYLNSSLGIQFSYPDVWYLMELTDSKDIFGVPAQVPAILLTSFDPANPPHKLEWTEQTISMQFRIQPIGTRPNSFENWVETHKEAALAHQLTIVSDERFSIANQPAAHLTLVSGAGGIIHQVLTILNNTEFEINIEGNFDLAKPVLDSVQPVPSGGLKPPDSDTPAAGICGDELGDPVIVILGNTPDGLPKAGRCIAINPAQRIRLINQSNGPFNIKFAEYYINLPVGGEILLDKPVGEYLAFGVHFLPMGPELWVKATTPAPTFTPIPPIATMPGSLRKYSNTEAGYSLTLPPGWNVDEYGLSNPNKEVLFYPGDTEPFITYLSISLDFRTLDQIKDLYAQSVPDAVREDTAFNGFAAVKYTFSYGRVEYYVQYQSRIYLIFTDKPMDGNVQQMLASIRFTPVTVMRYTNRELVYSLAFPPDWVVDENDLTAGTNKEVRIYPLNAEPFVSYLDIGLDPRSLEVLKAQEVPNATQMDIFIAGETGVEYMYDYGRIEIYLLHNGQVYYLISDKPTDERIGKMIGSFMFTQ